MICRNCLLRLSRQAPQGKTTSQTFRRALSASSSRQSTPISPQPINPRPNDLPAATSTSAAQPFTAGTVPKPSKKNAGPVRDPSSVLAGTPLRGINYSKNAQDPIAMEDHEYPEWLWTALDKNDALGDGLDGEGDLYSKSKKQRRKAAKALRKKELLNPDSLIPQIPLQEQTIDLPSGDGTLAGAKEALAARQELTRAMRTARRASIKESNFLKSMR